MFLHLVVLVFFVNYLKEKLNLLWKSQKHIIAHYFVVTLQYSNNLGTLSSRSGEQKSVSQKQKMMTLQSMWILNVIKSHFGMWWSLKVCKFKILLSWLIECDLNKSYWNGSYNCQWPSTHFKLHQFWLSSRFMDLLTFWGKLETAEITKLSLPHH